MLTLSLKGDLDNQVQNKSYKIGEKDEPCADLMLQNILRLISIMRVTSNIRRTVLSLKTASWLEKLISLLAIFLIKALLFYTKVRE